VAKEIFRRAKANKLEEYISQTVIDELAETPGPQRREQLLELVRDFEILPVTDTARGLANEYIKRGIIPKASVPMLCILLLPQSI